MKTPTLVRAATEGALLVTVWFNAHWSVALLLTVLVVSNEINARNIHGYNW